MKQQNTRFISHLHPSPLNIQCVTLSRLPHNHADVTTPTLSQLPAHSFQNLKITSMSKPTTSRGLHQVMPDSLFPVSNPKESPTNSLPGHVLPQSDSTFSRPTLMLLMAGRQYVYPHTSWSLSLCRDLSGKRFAPQRGPRKLLRNTCLSLY